MINHKHKQREQFVEMAQGIVDDLCKGKRTAIQESIQCSVGQIVAALIISDGMQTVSDVGPAIAEVASAINNMLPISRRIRI